MSSACYACLYGSNLSASKWPVMLDDSKIGGYEFNAGGCYAAESASEVACGTAQQNEIECEHAQCDPKSSDTTSYNSCVTTADNGVCSCWVSNATSACAGFTSSPCNTASTTSTKTQFTNVAKTMCGP